LAIVRSQPIEFVAPLLAATLGPPNKEPGVSGFSLIVAEMKLEKALLALRIWKLIALIGWGGWLIWVIWPV
jgi:hypothetical protein